MAKLINILKTLRNHWKKSIFACGLITYGSFYLRDRYRIEKMMRAYCEEAKNYGDMPLPVNGKPRHITVILNPVAKNGKGKAIYEKYAAPLLHLAGIKISVFQTEKEGQAKDLMEVMDNTDSVIVAGGNGTLHEAVTGLLRRSDAEIARQRFSIGILPIGKTNSLIKNLIPNSNEIELLAKSAMAIIKENKRAIDVMEIKGERGKPVYAVLNLELGVFRDTDSHISRYWVFGPLKTKIAYISRAFQEWPSNQEFDLSYIYPCGGCSKCYEKPIEIKSRRWWEAFIPKTPNISGISPAKDYTNIINEECGTWHSEQVPSPGILIETKNLETTNEEHFLNVVIHSSDLSRLQFINEGISRGKQKMEEETKFKKVIKVRELKLMLDVEEGKEQWCNIDTDNYEVQPVHVQLLPQKVYIYSNG
ncbi:acylglycerol kinase, mitochondrial [Centruroides vittatus]|uniref:acylglycerol kinase, mitochondrial n=1 Tax=Centruroides vittatus TaxID=120091 RepID=UPI003510B401